MNGYDLCKKRRRQLGLTPKLGVSDSALYDRLAATPPQGFREALWALLRRDIDGKRVKNDLFAGGILSVDGKGAGSAVGQAPHTLCRQSICDTQGTPYWDVFTLRGALTSSSARPVLDQHIIESKRGEATSFHELVERIYHQFPRLFRYITGGCWHRLSTQCTRGHSPQESVCIPHQEKLWTVVSVGEC